MAVITKTGVASGRACDLKAYRQLVKGEWGTAPPEEPNAFLVGFRARHYAVAAVHRLWTRNALVDSRVLGEVWLSAWNRAGGGEWAPHPDGLAWLEQYVRDNPFLGPVRGRRIIGVEFTLRTSFEGRIWQARPDVLAEDTNGAVIALELSGSKHPLLDWSGVRTMAALDQITLTGSNMPAALRTRARQVVVCELDGYRETDVTLSEHDMFSTLAEIHTWLHGLHPTGLRGAPTLDTCSRCAYRLDCPESFVSSTWTEQDQASLVVRS